MSDWVCLICCELSPYKVVGSCDHPVCLTCSAKLRELCEQKFCAVCREDLTHVLGVFQYSEGKYCDLKAKCKVQGRQSDISFEDNKIADANRALFSNRCKVCKIDCRTVKSLEIHLKKEHRMFFCEICRTNLKVFVKDLPVYSKENLREHKIKGDKNDKSLKGHPLCEFCQERFLDNETLHIHLRRHHFWCHLCDSQAFYCSYVDLRLHFKQKHLLCEMGECVNEQFTNVFKSDIDLQAHVTSRHKTELGKGQHRQMRRIELNLTYSSNRPPSRHTRNRLGGPMSQEEQLGYSDGGHWFESGSAVRSVNNYAKRTQLGKKPSSTASTQSSSSSFSSSQSSSSSSRTSSSSNTRYSPQLPPKNKSIRSEPLPDYDEEEPDVGYPPEELYSLDPYDEPVNLKSKPKQGARGKARNNPPPRSSPQTYRRDPETYQQGAETFRRGPTARPEPVRKTTAWGPETKNRTEIRRKPEKRQDENHFNAEDFRWMQDSHLRERERSRSRERPNVERHRKDHGTSKGKVLMKKVIETKSKEEVDRDQKEKFVGYEKNISNGITMRPTPSKAGRIPPEKGFKYNKIPDKIPEKKDDRIPEKKVDRIPEKKLDRIPEKKLDKIPEKKLDKIPEKKLDKQSQKSDEKEKEDIPKEPVRNCCVPNNAWEDKPQSEHPPVEKSTGKYEKELATISQHLSEKKDLNSSTEDEEPAKPDQLLSLSVIFGPTPTAAETEHKFPAAAETGHKFPAAAETDYTFNVTAYRLKTLHIDESSLPTHNPPPSIVPPELPPRNNPPPPQATLSSVPQPTSPQSALSKSLPQATLSNEEYIISTSGRHSPSTGKSSPALPLGLSSSEDFPPLPVSTAQPSHLTGSMRNKPSMHSMKDFPPLGSDPCNEVDDIPGPSIGLNNGQNNDPMGPPPPGIDRGSRRFPPGISFIGPPGMQQAPPGITRPPGITPPPGITNGTPRPPPGTPPPGLLEGKEIPCSYNDLLLLKINTVPSSYSDLLMVEPKNVPITKELVYQPVKDAEERMRELDQTLLNVFGQLTYIQFQTAVSALKTNKMEAASFIRICRQFIEQQYDVLFEEFIVLLTDIPLQTKLYHAMGSPKSIVPCTKCGQVLKRSEVIYHTEQYHNEENCSVLKICQRT